ncbi:ribosomal RNA small subunit methyltransferase A [Candidatus Saccharibacteria bacterium]|nr:ribosomal RNA small subunit methyltransferase A [Candidatus Saccharibacteria bacterium]
MAETKKELGQHWLRDEQILQSIVDAGEVGEGDYVLEIGPGEGTLTQKLIDTGAQIHAVEFDQDLIPALETKFAYCEKFAISSGDIRTFNFEILPGGYKIIANIPYYLTSNLIRIISESTNPPKVAVLLIQKEVAERICAMPGQMSILSVIAQFYFDCSLGVEVPAKYFTPPPKVDSQVVVLGRRNSKLFDVEDKEFFRLVKAGFSEKRKTLRNALSGGLRLEKSEVEQLLSSAGIDASRRAQSLSLDEWYKIYSHFSSQN